MGTKTALFPTAAESEPTTVPKWVKVEQCLTAACTVCDASLCDPFEEGAIFHFATFKELREEADRAEWTIEESGPVCLECRESAPHVIGA